MKEPVRIREFACQVEERSCKGKSEGTLLKEQDREKVKAEKVQNGKCGGSVCLMDSGSLLPVSLRVEQRVKLSRILVMLNAKDTAAQSLLLYNGLRRSI